jgi:hypothetical protein
VGKTIQKQRQKNEGQKHGDWVSSKNAYGVQKEVVNIFLSSIFLSWLS